MRKWDLYQKEFTTSSNAAKVSKNKRWRILQISLYNNEADQQTMGVAFTNTKERVYPFVFYEAVAATSYKCWSAPNAEFVVDEEWIIYAITGSTKTATLAIFYEILDKPLEKAPVEFPTENARPIPARPAAGPWWQ